MATQKTHEASHVEVEEREAMMEVESGLRKRSEPTTANQIIILPSALDNDDNISMYFYSSLL